MRGSFLIPVLAVALMSAQAQGADISTTTRLSLGIAKGFAPMQEVIDGISQGTGLSVTYNVKYSTNIEVPVLVRFNAHDFVSPVIGGAFLYSQNKNDYTISDPSHLFEISASDTFDVFGGKIYAGIALGNNGEFHAEFLPYIGYSQISVEQKAQISSSFASIPNQTASNNAHGNAFLYGATIGAYYTPESLNGFQVGGRIGYTGAKGQVEGDDVSQSGALIAAEVGWKF